MALTIEVIEICLEGCIEAAYKREEGIYRPYVGAVVLARDGSPVGIGTKEYISDSRVLYMHAERMALFQAGERARGGTLITTLEPCTRVPRGFQILKPCAELIPEFGIKTVVIGLKDTGSRVNGRGIKYLQDRGIEIQMYDGPQATRLKKLVTLR
ncbi:hypothetical protein EXS74_00940 [Candidatus Woesearchaeota archaeon]|nr:hypothetical protein [Candidatus Woesearchaeota archaeon]